MHHMEMFSSSLTEKRRQFEKRFQRFATATPFCLVCHRRLEYASWRSLVFGGGYICRSCFYGFHPVYKHLVIDDVKIMVIYEKNEQINTFLQAFLEEGHGKLGPALFSYPSTFLGLRYRNYEVAQIPECAFDPPFVPAEKVFGPFGVMVTPIFEERAVEKDDKYVGVLQLTKKAKIPSRVILFSCCLNRPYFKKAVALLRKRGVRHVIGLSFVE